jgi:putative copper export protein
VVLSHVLDGHTVTEGNRWLTGLTSAVHVLAAGVWVGGVAALALVIRRRWRRDEPTHSLVMVVRYSVVATIALAVVAVAGTYLAIVILDAPSELWTTEWGRFFVAKFLVVAIAAAFGAHNHHVIVPALELSEERPDVVDRLRSTLAKEVLALTAVTVLTAMLVRAASNL